MCIIEVEEHKKVARSLFKSIMMENVSTWKRKPDIYIQGFDHTLNQVTIKKSIHHDLDTIKSSKSKK